MMEQVFQRADEFDVVHFHTEPFHYSLARRQRVPTVTTLHGRLDIAFLETFFREFRDAPLVSISDAQRQPLPLANWVATVHHGLPIDLYAPARASGSYLIFLGRISPEKRPDRAIRIARRAGRELRIAAKVDTVDTLYYHREIEPMMRDPAVTYVGEITDADKAALLGGAAALLFPIDWPEPFGLVMIEAMACGTPVIAWDHGSVSEVVDDGETGFVVRSEDEAVAAIERIASIDRDRVRATFERRFSATTMAQRYLDVYERLRSPVKADWRRILPDVPDLQPPPARASPHAHG